MTGRKGYSEILKQSISLLRQGPVSVNELAKHLGSNWATAKRALETLGDFGIAGQQEREGIARIYFLKQELSPLVPQSNTLFNLTLSDDQLQACRALYAKIKKKWFDKTKQVPNKIQTQKVASRIARDFPALNIPNVWYLYGNTLILTYNASEDYSDAHFKAIEKPEILRKIDEAVNEYVKKQTSLEIMKLQYSDSNAPKIYSTKLGLHQLFNSYDLDDDSVQKNIANLLFKFSNELDRNTATQRIHSYLTEFCGILTRAFRQKNVNEYRLQIVSTFQRIWELVALYQFSQSAKKYFDEITIQTNIQPKLNRILLETQESIFELESLFPQNILPEELQKFQFLTKLKGSLTEKTTRTKEERLQDYEEFKKKITTNS